MRRFARTAVVLAFVPILAVVARAEDPAPPLKAERIRVVPDAIELSTARDRQAIVVQADFADGSTRDVTAAASASIEPDVATIQDGIVAPKADGRGKLKVSYEGVQAEVPLEVQRTRRSSRSASAST